MSALVTLRFLSLNTLKSSCLDFKLLLRYYLSCKSLSAHIYNFDMFCVFCTVSFAFVLLFLILLFLVKLVPDNTILRIESVLRLCMFYPHFRLNACLDCFMLAGIFRWITVIVPLSLCNLKLSICFLAGSS